MAIGERLKTWLGYAIVGALVAYLMMGRAPGCGGLGVKAGEAAPHFSVRDARGREWTPDAFASRPYALVFFATWCRSCREELPVLARVAADRPDLAFLAVSDEAPATVERYLSSARLRLPAAGDGQGAFHAFGVRALPSAVLVDSGGLVAWSGEGPSAVNEALRRLAEAGP